MSKADVAEDILEGFLCPICMKDLHSINLLQSHFESEHATEDKLTIQLLKGFLNKVKKLINEDDDNDENNIEKVCIDYLGKNAATPEQNNPWNWKSANLSKKRNHSETFKKIRSARIDSSVIETNKLIIRLDKLITHMPVDSVQRKAHEKSIVDWIDDSYVPLCPFCAVHFNISRRKHHCRLCGAITCEQCSQFLDFTDARKLIAPIHRGNPSSSASSFPSNILSSESKSVVSGQFGDLLSHIPKLKRSNSHNSLNSLLSMVDSIGKDPSLRICRHCLNCLDYRKRQVVKRSSKNLLSIYYQKLQEYRSTLECLIPEYREIANGLNDGSLSYDLDEAEALRSKILFTSESMSSCSNKIRGLGQNGVSLEGECNEDKMNGVGECPAGVQQDLLQRRIHACSLTFIKDEILALPKLPTREKLEELKAKRRKEVETALSMERQNTQRSSNKMLKLRSNEVESPTRQAGVTEEKQHHTLSQSFNKNPMEVLSECGWVSNTATHNVMSTDDPIVQQMSIIRTYIKEAKSCNRHEEVSMLEENLRQLQIEYKRQK